MNIHEDSPQTSAVPFRSIKTAFLSVVIAGVAAMGIISVIALLVGGFNDYIGRALLTITVLLTHAALALLVIAKMSPAYIRRSLVAKTILAVIAASIVTTTLGIWHVISAGFAWHFIGLYFLLIGGAFAYAWLAHGLIGIKKVDYTILAALVVFAAFIAALVPWVLTETPTFPSIYYRSIGALAIVITTLVVIGVIIRHIFLGAGKGQAQKSAFKGLPVLVIVTFSVIGGITAFVWLAGITGFTYDALGHQNRTNNSSPDYNDSQRPYDDSEGDSSDDSTDDGGASIQYDGSGNVY